METEKIIERAEGICLVRHMKPLREAEPWQLHDALALSVMREIGPQWANDQREQRAGRFACYLSAEYLTGRMIYNNLYAMGILEETREMLSRKGIDLAALEDIEDAALGNGGLGRLAACFLDSAATHGKPLFGYGLRYQYGLFRQTIEENKQCEYPDDWTRYGDPWSVRRDDLSVLVPMKGLTVRAVPYDMPVIGYGLTRIGTLRLWQCESLAPLDFAEFNKSKYQQAVKGKNAAEDITKLLYPNDDRRAGKRLRLKQQYVLCSATLQDLLRDFKRLHGSNFSAFPDYHAIQLNDTHPTMCIPELIRLLALEQVPFEQALEIARKTFAYTNHTVMQEALEKWELGLMAEVSPELAQVIRQLAKRQSAELKEMGIADTKGLTLLQGNTVHMAYLALYGGHAVNGVAEIHSEILKTDVLRDWYALKPEMFGNKTNGITQRRWLGLCNPELCAVLEKRIGKGFMTDLFELEKLKPMIESDAALTREFIAAKQKKKEQLSQWILKKEGVLLPPAFVYDVQIKRLHEYKRQLLNAFSALELYFRMKEGKLRDMPPVAVIFGGKAAASYARAKSVIRFINEAAALINNDPEVNSRLRVVFVQNYNCSYAEKIIPAADISEQISPAGTEASGTGNMKFMLNGAVTLGTYDGANIEIVEQAGEENNYIFGARLDDINAIRSTYDPKALYKKNPGIRRVMDMLLTFPDPDGGFRELYDALLKGASWHKPDHHYLLLDFDAYMDARIRAIYDTADAEAFAKKCLYNVAGAGKFSSDRTVAEYARDIWGI